MPVPDVAPAYRETLTEIGRLWELGELTPEVYARLSKQVLDATANHPHAGDIAEAVYLYDPNPTEA